MPAAERPATLELQTHRFQELDALRGLAAATVVFSHFLLVCANTRGYWAFVSTPLHLLVNGPEAVIVFFVLSGFVLSSLWSRSRAGGYAGYCVKRLLRLCLPFYAALLLAALGARHFATAVPTANAWINQTWSMQPTLPMLLNAAATGNRWAEQFNTAFWTVGYEIRISLVFPLLFWLAMRVPSWPLLSGAVGLQMALPVIHVLDRFADPELVAAVLQFLVGVVLFRHLRALLDWADTLSSRARVVLAVGSLALYACAIRAPVIPMIDVAHPAAVQAAQQHTPPVDKSLRAKVHRGLAQEVDVLRLQAGVLGAVGVIVSAVALPGLRRRLRSPGLLRLGALSYSTYLLHGTVLFVLVRLFYGRMHFAYLFPVYLALVYGVSETFHWAVDQPSILLSRRAESWIRGRRTAVPKASAARAR